MNKEPIPAELLATVEPYSTWQNHISGALWIVDHSFDDKSVVMQPDWRVNTRSGGSIVAIEELIRYWRKIETTAQYMDRIQYQRKVDCQLGRHEDPDFTGQCIKCGKVFDDD